MFLFFNPQFLLDRNSFLNDIFVDQQICWPNNCFLANKNVGPKKMPVKKKCWSKKLVRHDHHVNHDYKMMTDSIALYVDRCHSMTIIAIEK